MKKGFTLIELLAVIVVLAIIALIAIPIIKNVIDKAKVGALKDSAYGILEAGELYLAKNMSEGIDDTIEFTCSNGKCINGDKEITYKGQIETGRIRIYSDNKIELCITDNKNSALKKVTDKEVEVTTGTCNYDELSYDVSALVSKDDYDKVVNELNDLKALVNQTDATVSDIAKDKKAVTNDGLITGTATVGLNRITIGSYGQAYHATQGSYTDSYTTSIKNYTTNWSNLSTSNFAFSSVAGFKNGINPTTANGQYAPGMSYNANTGILTVTIPYYRSSEGWIIGISSATVVMFETK